MNEHIKEKDEHLSEEESFLSCEDQITDEDVDYLFTNNFQQIESDSIEYLMSEVTFSNQERINKSFDFVNKQNENISCETLLSLETVSQNENFDTIDDSDEYSIDKIESERQTAGGAKVTKSKAPEKKLSFKKSQLEVKNFDAVSIKEEQIEEPKKEVKQTVSVVKKQEKGFELDIKLPEINFVEIEKICDKILKNPPSDEIKKLEKEPSCGPRFITGFGRSGYLSFNCKCLIFDKVKMPDALKKFTDNQNQSAKKGDGPTVLTGKALRDFVDAKRNKLLSDEKAFNKLLEDLKHKLLDYLLQQKCLRCLNKKNGVLEIFNVNQQIKMFCKFGVICKDTCCRNYLIWPRKRYQFCCDPNCCR